MHSSSCKRVKCSSIESHIIASHKWMFFSMTKSARSLHNHSWRISTNCGVSYYFFSLKKFLQNLKWEGKCTLKNFSCLQNIDSIKLEPSGVLIIIWDHRSTKHNVRWTTKKKEWTANFILISLLYSKWLQSSSSSERLTLCKWSDSVVILIKNWLQQFFIASIWSCCELFVVVFFVIKKKSNIEFDFLTPFSDGFFVC